LPSPQALSFFNLIDRALPGAGDIDRAGAAVRRDLEGFVDFSAAATEAAFNEGLELVREKFKITILRRNSIVLARPEWYRGPVPGDHHWPALERYLSDVKGWSETTVKTIDDGSNEIVSLLENPQQQKFDSRGLVVGYVQSGKTANMAAVISKAVDRGYNLVVVFAGLTDKLRQQTQRRLDADIVSRNPGLWYKLTTDDINGEFGPLPNGQLTYLAERAQIAVMKKNVAPLRRFLESIIATPSADLDRLIDDECDQAGVNGAKEMAMGPINEKIRHILNELPAATYVGYTATPFANVLINPYAEQTEGLQDIYPKNFIAALPLPDGYFGTQKLFGRTPADPADPQPDEEGMNVIRKVSIEDEAMLQPASRKAQAAFVPQMPQSLEDAILYFVATCAARRARGQAGEHMSMLIHTSSSIAMHEAVAELVKTWIEDNCAALIAGTGEISKKLEDVWNAERGAVPLGREPETFDALKPFIKEILELKPAPGKKDPERVLQVPIENGTSEDRIDYTGAPVTYIVIGGSILARGLTIEGLCVSYFLRTSGQYDTLLQMGRWFGYRHGYEDLARIWMPELQRIRYRALAAIEAEIREDITNYSRSPSVTPMDFAVRIRRVPGMAIIARNKMKHAHRSSIGYWGRHLQTIRFAAQDRALLEANWAAAGRLVDEADAEGAFDADADKLLFRNVPRAAVIRFLKDYVIDESHQDLQRSLLLSFLQQGHPALSEWNVGVVTAGGGADSEHHLGHLGRVQMVKRSRMDLDSLADIKALMSRADVTFDVPQKLDGDDWEALKTERRNKIGEKPLLLIYPIDRNSLAKAGGPRRDLDAVHDVIGLGLVLPLSKEHGGDFVNVELAALTPEEIEAMEQEELDAVEAFGRDEPARV